MRNWGGEEQKLHSAVNQYGEVASDSGWLLRVQTTLGLHKQTQNRKHHQSFPAGVSAEL